MSQVPGLEDATQAAVAALTTRRWREDFPHSAHAEHQYDGACPVCRHDQPESLQTVARVVLEAGLPVLLAELDQLKAVNDKLTLDTQVPDLLTEVRALTVALRSTQHIPTPAPARPEYQGDEGLWGAYSTGYGDGQVDHAAWAHEHAVCHDASHRTPTCTRPGCDRPCSPACTDPKEQT